jgi:meiosis induction protein kinase IME2/SME1
VKETIAPKPSPVQPVAVTEAPAAKPRPSAVKRSTWANGLSNAAPMPILPTIRPISPLSDAVTAQASNNLPGYSDSYANAVRTEEKSKKIGRQLSVASSTNHYAEIHRQQAERALNGNSGLMSPPSAHKESFFSHLRKRARRFSGRHQTPISPTYDDVEAQAGCGPWASNRSSMVIDNQSPGPKQEAYESLDKALRDVQNAQSSQTPAPPSHQVTPSSTLKRHHSLPQHQPRSVDNLIGAARASGPISSRTRRAQASQGMHHYEAPDEEDELLDEVLATTRRAMNRLEKDNKPSLRQSSSNIGISNPYPTPSPSASGTALFGDGHETVTPKPLDLGKKSEGQHKWPTPPYEESEWAASASASIWAASNRF